MTPQRDDFVQRFDGFWSHVKKHERDVRENGHLGRIPPDCHGDDWDDEFAAEYELLRPYLKTFSEERFYQTPPGIACCAMPITAETAHQALMFFLNPSIDLHGEAGVLDSAEYKAIKAAAMLELAQMEQTLTKRKRSKSIPSTRNRRSKDFQELSDDAKVLLSFLMAWHKCKTDGPNFTAVKNQGVIAQGLSNRVKIWNQTRVSRTMSELMKDVRRFDHLKATTRYKRLCEAREICSVLIQISLKPLRKGLTREFGLENLDQFHNRGF